MREQNMLDCEKIRIEKCSINGFSIDVVKACDLYMYLGIFWEFDDWLKCVILDRKAARDFFHAHSESGSTYLFSIKMAKEIAIEDGSTTSKKVGEYLLAYEENLKRSSFDDVLLSEVDKNSVVQDFAEAVGCDDKSIIMPIDTLVAMVDTIKLCKVQIDQIQNRLSKFDFAGVDQVDSRLEF